MPAEFSRAVRLRRRGEFSGVFELGTKRHGRLMTAVVLPTEGSVARIGIAASRKLGGAVERNCAKRRVREVFRLAPGGRSADIVIVPRREILRASHDDVAREFVALVDGAIRHGRRQQPVPSSPRGSRRDRRV